jgi:serine/threonine protein kinase/predicted Zn-dependent protease
MNPYNPTAVSPDVELDAYLARFESAAANGEAPDLADYLPAPNHRKYLAVLRELIRADLEFAWQRGEERRLDAYELRFPDLFADPEALADVALEEYRQRMAAGNNPDPSDYRRRFAVHIPVAAATTHAPTVSIGAVPQWTGSAFPVVGDVIAPGFRVLAELGRGAFGRVYLAEQTDLADRRVAVKVSARLIGEAHTLARLQHTHIVPVYGVQRVGTYQVLVMPYLGATTLADLIRSIRRSGSVPVTVRAIWTEISSRGEERPERSSPPRAPGPPAERPDDEAGAATVTYEAAVLGFGISLADALAHAHSRGILHRDVKPANVLLTDDARAMLVDFNLAADTSQQASVGGTPRYMAPEQLAALESSATVDARADIYSLGLVLHEALTGRIPFAEHAGPLAGVLSDIRNERLTRPVVRLTSPALSAILRRCLEPKPADRYASAADLRDDLARHRDHRPLQFAREPWSRERVRKWARRHPRLSSGGFVAIVAGILLLVAGSIVYSLWIRSAESAARDARDVVRDTRDVVKALAFAPGAPTAQYEEARNHLRNALAPYGLPTNERWLSSPAVQRLPDEAVEPLRADLAEVLFFGAEATARVAHREVDPARRIALFDEALLLNARAADAHSAGPGRPVAIQRTWILKALGRAADESNSNVDAGARPGSPFLDAMAALEEGRYDDAANTLETLTAREQGSFHDWMALGICRFKLADYDRAAEAFLVAAAIRPAAAWPYFWRAVSLLSANRHGAETVEACDRFVALRPFEPDGWINRAVLRIRTNDPKAALVDLDEAERLAGATVRGHALRQEAWRALGDLARAAESRQQLLATAPSDAVGWTIRGEAKLADEPAAAVVDFDEALRIEPDHLPALRGKASALSEHLGRPADAAALLKRILLLPGASVEDRAGRSVLLARLGQTEEAKAEARACVRPGTGALPLYQAASALAITARTPDDRAEVVRVLRLALRRDPDWAMHMTSDADLKAVHANPQFQALIAAARQFQVDSTGKIQR